jgi:integrase
MPAMSFDTFSLQRALANPPAAKGAAVAQVDYSDKSTRGFMLRVSSTGAASWQFLMRLRTDTNKKLRRFTIGKAGPGGMSLEDARAEARRLRAIIKAKEDPKEISDAAEQRRQKQEAMTVERVVEQYIERKLAKLRSRNESERMIRLDILPRWRLIPVHEIKRSHFVEMRDQIGARGPVIANRTVALAAAILHWWAGRSPDEAYREPVLPDDFWFPEKGRERTLSDDELRKLWSLWEQEPLLGPLCQLILLTAQRPGNTQEMQWREIDEANALWIIPAGKFKTDTEQVVPLSAAAMAIVKRQKRHTRGDFVLSTTGVHPYTGYPHRKVPLDKRAGIAAYTLHDLRRTARSLMSRPLDEEGDGILPDIAERVLGHAVGGVRGIYDRHTYSKEKRRAVNHLAAAVAKILAPTLALPAPSEYPLSSV